MGTHQKQRRHARRPDEAPRFVHSAPTAGGAIFSMGPRMGATASTSTSLLAGYRAGEEMPLGGYATLLGAYGLALGGFLWRAERVGRLPSRPRFGDVVLVGVATHKLTRIVTHDWVTAPIRAPFTQYVESLGHGEVKEKSRGQGLRRAVGDLLTCPFCAGPWIAGALLGGLTVAPRVTRFIAGLFAAVALSDVLHHAYERLSSTDSTAS
jgi:Protein of unknown function (DUF1360)